MTIVLDNSTLVLLPFTGSISNDHLYVFIFAEILETRSVQVILVTVLIPVQAGQGAQGLSDHIGLATGQG